jgi:hypothetical protein
MKTLLHSALLHATLAFTLLLPILPEPQPHHAKPDPITAPEPTPEPTQPYPCIVGIVFANGVPVLTLICQ